VVSSITNRARGSIGGSRLPRGIVTGFLKELGKAPTRILITSDRSEVKSKTQSLKAAGIPVSQRFKDFLNLRLQGHGLLIDEKTMAQQLKEAGISTATANQTRARYRSDLEPVISIFCSFLLSVG
jgi:hypothetical protein